MSLLFLQEWYSNLKPTTTKTPNTSSDSKSEDEFVTASECTCTPPSRSSSFQTASEGGAISPWWEIDPISDSDEKMKTDSSMDTIRKQIRSPSRIISETPNELIVREISEASKLSPTGIASYLLENPNGLLRPCGDRATNSNEIVRQLSQIVKAGESFEESSPCESDKIELPEVPKTISDYRYDCDTSSQYSSELLNTDFIPTVPVQNHSKSLSYETDNTDMSLPKFSAEISVSAQAEIPRFHTEERPKSEMSKYLNPRSDPNKIEHYRPNFKHERSDYSYHQSLQRYNNDESSKIYIIDASTPSPKSKRYLETSFDSLELFHQPTRKVVEAEVHHHQQEDLRRKIPELNDALAEKVKEVKERRRPVTTIDLQGACALPTSADYYYQAQITRMAIKGIF